MFRWILMSAGLIAVSLVGCGGYTPDEGVVVTGKIVQGGAPVAVAPTPDGYNGVEVQILPATPTDTGLASASAQCDTSGNFEITYAGEGVPPGKYKLAVFVRKDDPGADTLEGKLGGDTTPITIDVPEDKKGGKHDVGTIDIATHLK